MPSAAPRTARTAQILDIISKLRVKLNVRCLVALSSVSVGVLVPSQSEARERVQKRTSAGLMVRDVKDSLGSPYVPVVSSPDTPALLAPRAKFDIAPPTDRRRSRTSG